MNNNQINTETFLFNETIFGPIKSRRLGNSLGINLLPIDSKLCNFDCIYCECGLTEKKQNVISLLSQEKILAELKSKLIRLQSEGARIDTITFAGNGEPTLHPQFKEIVDDVIILGKKYFPSSKVAVLSNGIMLDNENVKKALMKVDFRILKLDAGTEKMFQQINQPVKNKTLLWLVERLKEFNGNLIIQTLFVKGINNAVVVDNANEEEVKKWLRYIEEIYPELVMIYSLDRATPIKNLQKIPHQRLSEISKLVNELGIKTMVS